MNAKKVKKIRKFMRDTKGMDPKEVVYMQAFSTQADLRSIDPSIIRGTVELVPECGRKMYKAFKKIDLTL